MSGAFRTKAWLPAVEAAGITIDAWWPEIETFILTRATNARTEAANVTIKNLKRAGRGYRSPANSDAASWPTTLPGTRHEHLDVTRKIEEPV